ncbi:hypothetical protein N0V90_004519 [Kalmusia sp. IMI 367209]|nr:hypothetical protein N0V90_004519 [Kalmusia sp. IMI 367209]
MAEVRRHLTERAQHLPFLKLCSTCNEHSVDKEDFEKQHGYKGEKCDNPRKQARGREAMEAQWWQVYKLVNSENPNEAPVQNDAAKVPVGSPKDEPQPSRPYKTPYELIIDSDSDDANLPSATSFHSLPPFDRYTSNDNVRSLAISMKPTDRLACLQLSGFTLGDTMES